MWQTMMASKRANAMPSAFVARQSLNDEELVSIITPYCHLSVFEEHVFYVSFRFKNMNFLTFFYSDLSKSRKSQQKFRHQSVKMSSYTSLSVITGIQFPPSSRSVIHSEPLLNVNVYRNVGLKIPGCCGDL